MAFKVPKKEDEQIKSVMLGNVPTPTAPAGLSAEDRQYLIDQGLNPDDYQYQDEAPVAPSGLTPEDRQYLIDQGEDPDKYQYADEAPKTDFEPWAKQEEGVAYYDANTPIKVDEVEMEVPASLRFEVGALTKPEDKLAAIRKEYPDAQPVGTDQYIMRDKTTGKPMVFNVKGWVPSWGDVGDAAPEIVGGVGGLAGGIVGGAMGAGAGSVVPVVGTTTGALAAGSAGAGIGYGSGRDLYQRGANLVFGNQDTRGVAEQELDKLQDIGIGALGEVGGLAAGNVISKAAGGIGKALSPSRMVGGLKEADDAALAASRLKSFESVGIQPTPGMIGGTNAASREHALSKGVPAMQNKVEDVTNQLGQRFEDTIARTTGGNDMSPAAAGEAIQRRAQDFRDVSKQRQNDLYDNVGRLTDGIPAAAPNTTKFLETTKNELANLGASAKLNNSKAYDDAITQATAIVQDVQKGASFNTLKDARTNIGDLAFGSSNGTKETQIYRNLYKSLTEDMAATAEKGGVDVLQAWNKANNFSKRTKNSGNLVSNDTTDLVLRKKTPEAVHQLMVSGSKRAGSTVQQIMRQVRVAGGDDAVKEVGSSVFNTIGRSKDGTFSPAKLIGDWDGMSKEAKQALYMTKDGNELRRSMEDIVSAAKTLTQYNASKNHSNTSATLMTHLNRATNVGSLAAGISSANPMFLMWPLLRQGVGSMANGYQTKIFSSPETLKWMAGLKRESSAKAAINKLAYISSRTRDEALKFSIRDYLQDVQNQ
ncbi:hypothetical protein [Agrobacterium rosae]|uniref:Uncharacterized protein n=1 Tax=Agrobacterium rosae TaxID=1972867 RepID=A0A1R3TIW3_9HYPH|nr:hypothetical protein [Agrobacterium rosae]SCX19602.1 hypothetical protein DSM25559_1868 [Agrobacterium rosae]